MTGSDATADDVTQEVFVTLIRNLRRYEPQRAGLLTYLYGIARNVTRNRLRRDCRFVGLERARDTPCPVSDDPHHAAARAQQRARLREAIRTLPSRYREAIILSDVQGLSYAETARVLNLPVGTVRSRLSRGRHMIGVRLRKIEERGCLPVSRIERCVV